MMRNTIYSLIYTKGKQENENFIPLLTYHSFHFLLKLYNNLFALGIVRYDLLRTLSYLPTPKELKHLGALVNVINTDE